jgi:HlyD family secretion protein
MTNLKKLLKDQPLLWIIPGVAVLALVIVVTSHVFGDTTRYLTGTVEATHVDVAAKIPARVQRFLVEEGQEVKAGDTLMVFENREVGAKVAQARAVLAAAEARYAMALHGARKEEVAMAEDTYKQAEWGVQVLKKTYDRMKQLHDEGVVSSQQWDEVDFKYRAAVEQRDAALERFRMVKAGARTEEKDAAYALTLQARNTVAEAESYYDESTLRAPISGVVEKKIVDPGELVAAGYPLVTVVDPHQWWVIVHVPESEIGTLAVGQTIECKAPSRKGAVIPMRVARISVMSDFATKKATNEMNSFDVRTFEVKLVPGNASEPMFEGASMMIPLAR